jgi:hypothetical protein
MERQIIRYQGELWSEIPGHHGKYFASRNGQILSLAKSQSKPRVLRQIRDGEYLHVFLYDGTREKLRVHRAVLLAWDREPLPVKNADILTTATMTIGWKTFVGEVGRKTLMTRESTTKCQSVNAQGRIS